MRRIPRAEVPHVRIEFEGQALLVPAGDTVAAALLGADQWRFRSTPVSGAARGPFCMMGVCFDCLVEIDGVANRQACMVEVRDGMRVNIQQGASDIGAPGFACDEKPSPP